MQNDMIEPKTERALTWFLIGMVVFAVIGICARISREPMTREEADRVTYEDERHTP